jgi:hypothetical protein
MKTKPISPKVHGIADYVLVSSLLTLPSLLGFQNKVRNFYAFEALTLLTYIGVTDHPTAIKPLIPFTTHGRIDPFNIAHFALQSFWKPIRGNKKALLFNIGFTIIAGTIVTLTDWHGPTKPTHK